MTDTNKAADITVCDVLVLGGGPAGSTISTLLADRGRHVVMVEKDKHPRFHIGESLLPLNLPLLEQLGVHDKVRQVAMFKYGAEFTSPQHSMPVMFNFSDAWDKNYPHAYEVTRSQFDEILFRNAVAHGVHALEEARVVSVDFKNTDFVFVTAQQRDGTIKHWKTQFFVDASGRDTFLADRFRMKQKNPKHGSAAIYAHFTGAKRLPGREEGNISLFWFEHGWFWFIPLQGGVTSVGAVCWPYYMNSRKTDPTTFLMDTIGLCPPLADRLENAELAAPVRATGNYSYTAKRMIGDRHVLLGDAFAFIDPVFSSGVLLAMNSAFMAADPIDTYLTSPAKAAAKFRRMERRTRLGLRHFSWFIYRMTNPAIRDLFMAPRNALRMQEALISLLAGDLYRSTPIFWSLRAFKVVYYLNSLLNPLRSLRAWWHRRHVIRVESDPTLGSRA